MRTLACTLIISSAFLAQTAWSAVREVPQQYATINEAVTAAVAGDTIKIDKGRYQEAVATTKKLTFQGKNGTIWDGYYGTSNAHSQLTVTANGVKVGNIEFQNGTSPVNITGDNAYVSGCTFKGTTGGVLIVGASASVSKNGFNGLQGNNKTVDITGPDAIVDDNEIMDCASAYIVIDAMNLGTVTITDNYMNTSGGHTPISVTNATAPVVRKNKILNCEVNSAGIEIDQCNDAVVYGNVLKNLSNDASIGISVTGDRAVVSKNKVENIIDCNSDTYGINVVGSSAKITKNTVRSCGAGEQYDSCGIYVEGPSALIESNLVEDLAGGGNDTSGIALTLGHDSTVSKNTVRNLCDEFAYGLDISGHRVTVRKNKISDALYESLLQLVGWDFTIEKNVMKNGGYVTIGISVSGGATVPGAAVVQGNKLSNTQGGGIRHNGDGVLIQENTVKHSAGDGVHVNGSGNTLKNNKVDSTGNDAFLISGDGNSMSKCVARNAARDGFDINGIANTLHKCKAYDCAAEGLDNGAGINTTATDCTLKGSRIDYAGNGSMSDDTGTTYQTGGAGTAPEID